MNCKEPITTKQWHSYFFNISTNLISPVSKIAAAICSELGAMMGMAVRAPASLANFKLS